ncbi:hypothetical protein B5S31_g2796 [[Candida] boidinii]|nr:hypothetical protein B5S31_g2796 [[Candida] boidinii]
MSCIILHPCSSMFIDVNMFAILPSEELKTVEKDGYCFPHVSEAAVEGAAVTLQEIKVAIKHRTSNIEHRAERLRKGLALGACVNAVTTESKSPVPALHGMAYPLALAATPHQDQKA